MPEGFIRTSKLLRKKLSFLHKYTRHINIKPTRIYTTKFFLDLPSFVNFSFKIDSRTMNKLVSKNTRFVMLNGTILVTNINRRNKEDDDEYELDGTENGINLEFHNENREYNDEGTKYYGKNMRYTDKNNISNGTMQRNRSNGLDLSNFNQNMDNLIISENFKIFEIDDISLNLEDPLLSIEPRHDFISFLSHMDPKTTIFLEVAATGTLICKIEDFIEFEYKQTGCKIPLSNINTINVKFKTEEIVFLKDLMDTTIIFCIFDECLIIYSYEQNSTLAVQIPLLL